MKGLNTVTGNFCDKGQWLRVSVKESRTFVSAGRTKAMVVLKLDMLPNNEMVGTLGKPMHSHVGEHVGG